MSIKIEDLSKINFSDIADNRLLPVHPGEILLEDFLKPLDISQYKLAKDIQVPARRINEIVHGTRGISADTGVRLSRYFGMNDGFWVGLQSDYEIAKVNDSLADFLATMPHAPTYHEDESVYA